MRWRDNALDEALQSAAKHTPNKTEPSLHNRMPCVCLTHTTTLHALIPHQLKSDMLPTNKQKNKIKKKATYKLDRRNKMWYMCFIRSVLGNFVIFLIFLHFYSHEKNYCMALTWNERGRGHAVSWGEMNMSYGMCVAEYTMWAWIYFFFFRKSESQYYNVYYDVRQPPSFNNSSHVRLLLLSHCSYTYIYGFWLGLGVGGGM